MIDFLILYEHKAREIENICLIRAELEKRGYTVEFYNVNNLFVKKRPKLKAKVVVASAMYSDEILRLFVAYIVGNVKKVVNLQWEQILSNYLENNENCLYHVKGSARQVVHICWGEHNRKNLIKYGVKPEKALITGPVQMDFLRDEFKSYYLSKEKLYNEYKLSVLKKTCLFISSFSYVNRPEQTLEDEKKAAGSYFNAIFDVSAKSQEIVLEWIEKLLKESNDINFIYRPHPAELESKILSDLEDRYDNFYIIRELSIKQWILVCDIIFTWYSTSSAEVFFANKTFEILRPIEIPEEMDITIFKDAHMIKTYDEFLESISIKKTHLPIKEEFIYENYDVNKNKASYLRVCNLLEEVLNTSKYDLGFDLLKVLPKFTIKEYFKYSFIYEIYIIIARKLGLILKQYNIPSTESIKKRLIIHDWLNKESKKNIATSVEIEEIMIKLRGIINGK